MSKVRMVVDASNLLFRVASMSDARGKAGHVYESDEQKAGFALHVSFNMMLKYYKKYKPQEIALAFEGGKNWRKQYTKQFATQLPIQYKASRVWDSSKQTFFDLIDQFRTLIKEHSNILCLCKPTLEGDDVIAGYAQRHAQNGDEVYIISGDRDFIQLYKHKGVHLIDPASGKERIQQEKNFDAEYFLFEKCIRGDMGDDVHSAYPRVRETKIKQAFTDPYAREQMMKFEWSIKTLDEVTGEEKEQKFVVGDLYNHNKILVDLEAQPPEIRALIDEALDEAQANVGKFSYFHFMKFLGAHELNAIADKADSYAEMMSVSGRAEKAVNENAIEVPKTISASEFLSRRNSRSASSSGVEKTNSSNKLNGLFED